jgi:hypothetical protein
LRSDGGRCSERERTGAQGESQPAALELPMKGESRVNESGNYTKPGMRREIFQRIKSGDKGGRSGQWSARKAQMLARQYKSRGGGYR